MIIIKYKGNIIENIEIVNKSKFIITTDEGIFNIRSMKDIVTLICSECEKFRTPRIRYDILTQPQKCLSCSSKGKGNYFYGRKHSKETKDSIGKANKGQLTGNKNPFYGKKHSKETIEILREKSKINSTGDKNPFYGKKHSKETIAKIVKSNAKVRAGYTEEDRLKLSKNLKEAIKLLKEKDINLYIDNKRKGGIASSKSQNKYLKMNKIEEKVNNKLIELDLIDFKYSTILGRMQYDLGSKTRRILIEVNGDYWHCNPKFYSKPKNGIQKKKIAKDKKKLKFANRHNFNLIIIWEDEINSGDWTKIESILTL